MAAPDNDEGRGAKNLIVAAIVIVLVVGTVWLMLALKKSNDTMNCLAQHRTNCMPVRVDQ